LLAAGSEKLSEFILCPRRDAHHCRKTYNNKELMAIALKRVYEPATPTDGYRILVDRLWPRGVSKAKAGVDEWLRDIAPSNALRKWFHANSEEWAQFRKRYFKELSTPETQRDLQQLRALVRERKRLTLLYSSKNEERNNAVVLRDFLEEARKSAQTVKLPRMRANVPR
jgi:uncharacterized protein YeaO (DUF488 family)